VGTLASPWLEGSMWPEVQDDGRRKRPPSTPHHSRPYETNPLSEGLMHP